MRSREVGARRKSRNAKQPVFLCVSAGNAASFTNADVAFNGALPGAGAGAAAPADGSTPASPPLNASVTMPSFTAAHALSAESGSRRHTLVSRTGCAASGSCTCQTNGDGRRLTQIVRRRVGAPTKPRQRIGAASASGNAGVGGLRRVRHHLAHLDVQQRVRVVCVEHDAVAAEHPVAKRPSFAVSAVDAAGRAGDRRVVSAHLLVSTPRVPLRYTP
jgi:hypothetical protein